MDSARARRPRISRETRLVILTALVAIVALWALARIRFPAASRENPAAQQMLTSLASRPAFEAFAGRVAAAASTAAPRLVGITLADTPLDPAAARNARVPGWRFRDNLVLVHLPASAQPALDAPAELVARSAPLQLAVISIPKDPISPVDAAWTNTFPTGPRYVLATDPLATGVALRPVWVGGVAPVESPLWSSTVFEVPLGTDLLPGNLLFTNDGEWLGLAVAHGTNVAVVPAAVVIREADLLIQRAAQQPGDLGIEVQPLSPSTARATGASSGMLVAWLAANSPATGKLTPGDVIETADGQPVTTLDHWQRYVSRLVAGTVTSLRVRRHDKVQELSVIPTPLAPTAATPQARRATSLGLMMRFIPGSGSEITAVEPRSLGFMAGLEPGDVITWVGSAVAPEPMLIRQAVSAAAVGRPILLGVQRGTRHRVTTIER